MKLTLTHGPVLLLDVLDALLLLLDALVMVAALLDAIVDTAALLFEDHLISHFRLDRSSIRSRF